MKDEYGSLLREKMKDSMAQPWRATNKRESLSFIQRVGDSVALFCYLVVGLAIAALAWFVFAQALQWIR